MEAVIGSRTITYFNFTRLNLTQVITGGAKGIDQAVEKYCWEKKIPCKSIKPNYIYGRAAPLMRNKEIVDQATKVYAIWDGKSKGTRQALLYAIEKNKLIELFIIKGQGEIHILSGEQEALDRYIRNNKPTQ